MASQIHISHTTTDHHPVETSPIRSAHRSQVRDTIGTPTVLTYLCGSPRTAHDEKDYEVLQSLLTRACHREQSRHLKDQQPRSLASQRFLAPAMAPQSLVHAALPALAWPTPRSMVRRCDVPALQRPHERAMLERLPIGGARHALSLIHI